MLYIEGSSFEEQLQALKIVAGGQRMQLVLWLYPESRCNELADFRPLHSPTYEPVTTYADGTSATALGPVYCSLDAFDKLNQHQHDISKACDSIALYPENTSTWIACIIGHEGMTLIKDVKLFSRLKAHGLPASDTPPAWW